MVNGYQVGPDIVFIIKSSLTKNLICPILRAQPFILRDPPHLFPSSGMPAL